METWMEDSVLRKCAEITSAFCVQIAKLCRNHWHTPPLVYDDGLADTGPTSNQHCLLLLLRNGHVWKYLISDRGVGDLCLGSNQMPHILQFYTVVYGQGWVYKVVAYNTIKQRYKPLEQLTIVTAGRAHYTIFFIFFNSGSYDFFENIFLHFPYHLFPSVAYILVPNLPIK